MQASNRGLSVIQDVGKYSSNCGYCNGADGETQAHGMHAYRLTVYDYQELLDQGWRRSGTFLYKPDNKATCCRQYTIRLDATAFRPSKAQKKLLRKWEAFLAGHLPEEASPARQQQQQQTPGTAAGAAGQTASAKRARSTSVSPSNQQQQQQQQPAASGAAAEQSLPGGASALMQEVHALLQAAVAGLALPGAGEQDLQRSVKVLPAAAPPKRPSHNPKHTTQPPGTQCSSPCAHVLAAAMRKRQQQQPQQQQQEGLVGGARGSAANGSGDQSTPAWTSAEALAELLAGSFNSLAAGRQPPLALTAIASRGHVNFVRPGQQQQQQQQQAGAAEPVAAAAAAATSAAQAPRGGQPGGSSNKQPAGKQQQQRHKHQQQQHPEQHQQQQQGRRHHLEVRMVPNQFIQEEFELWCKYQAAQHHDDPADLQPSQYKNFLVDTPLLPVPPAQQQQQQQHAATSAVPPCGYGSFHQQYWLDGKLVAVGVVDVLPRCLSSKYFFWDPDHAWLSLGRYGALREIQWVAQHAAAAAGAGAGAGAAGAGSAAGALPGAAPAPAAPAAAPSAAAPAPQLRFYYLGYYIHGCPKMAYKAEYAPSELLCPARQVWVSYGAHVAAALDASPYVELSGLPGARCAPNLSVPRPLPAPAAGGSQAAGGSDGAGSGRGASGAAGVPGGDALGLGSMPALLELQQQMQRQQESRGALDGQLLLLSKQAVRWGALRASGMLGAAEVSAMDEQLAAWQAVVGETRDHLLYAAPRDLL